MGSGENLQNNNFIWKENELEYIKNCPLCGSTSYFTIYDNIKDKSFYSSIQNWSIQLCQSCGGGFLSPRPSKETIHKAYSTYYTHVKPSKLGEFQLALINGYRNWRFKANYQPANRLGIYIFLLLRPFRIKIHKQMRGLTQNSNGKKILDVGFGTGDYLELANGFGCVVSGVDFDPVVVKAAMDRGFDVRQGNIDAFTDMPESFDLITLSHFIEHVYDPTDVIRQIYQLLKPGGKVWIETPNIDSYSHRKFGSNWRGLEPPRHLALFNWKNLESMLLKAGFTQISRIPRHDVYRKMATLSRVIENSNKEYVGLLYLVYDSIIGLLRGIQSRINYSRSEHITLIAYKKI